MNHEDAIQTLNHELIQDPSNTIVMNRLAIAHLECNQYERALELFERAVRTKRTVQALHNLAWMYANEGEPNSESSWTERPDKSIPLLEEVVQREPQTEFPYSLLGEMYLRFGRYEDAVSVLRRSLQRKKTMRALTNLGVALYHLADYSTAADYFLQAADLKSETAHWNRIMALVKAKSFKTAHEEMKRLSAITAADPLMDYGGPLLLAQLFLAVKDYDRAAEQFELAFSAYWLDHEWVSEYLYALKQLGRHNDVTNVFERFLVEVNARITSSETDEWETEEDRQQYLREQTHEIVELTRLKSEGLNGFVPHITFEPYMEYGCYLFGCTRHGYGEYNDEETSSE